MREKSIIPKKHDKMHLILVVLLLRRFVTLPAPSTALGVHEPKVLNASQVTHLSVAGHHEPVTTFAAWRRRMRADGFVRANRRCTRLLCPAYLLVTLR